MTARPLPPAKFLRECFRYDPETGLFWWKQRPNSHFPTEEVAYYWNLRHGGAAAFQSADKDGYLRCEVVFEGSRMHLRASRVAWKMHFDEEPEMVDHRDLDVANNRLANLRASDRFGNRHNAPGHRTHDLPKGVSRDRGKFRAKGGYKGQIFRLGSFDTPAEAHEAYCAWARPLHGEFFNPGPAKGGVFD
jgi:hypothetical protein